MLTEYQRKIILNDFQQTFYENKNLALFLTDLFTFNYYVFCD